jgi:hypothetical protein
MRGKRRPHPRPYPWIIGTCSTLCGVESPGWAGTCRPTCLWRQRECSIRTHRKESWPSPITAGRGRGRRQPTDPAAARAGRSRGILAAGYPTPPIPGGEPGSPYTDRCHRLARRAACGEPGARAGTIHTANDF